MKLRKTMLAYQTHNIDHATQNHESGQSAQYIIPKMCRNVPKERSAPKTIFFSECSSLNTWETTY